MSQPSVACFFNNRKRAAIEDSKIHQVTRQDTSDDVASEKLPKLQSKEEKIEANKIVSSGVTSSNKKVIKATRGRKVTKAVPNSANIEELFKKMHKSEPEITEIGTELPTKLTEEELHKTPPKSKNAMDKIKPTGPSLKEIKNKMTRSVRLAELKASISRFQEGAKKLSEIEKKTSQIPDSPKLNRFKTIELEVQTSPQKLFSPEKAYLSPRKEGLTVRKNLLNLLSPTKNAVPIQPQSPSKQLLSETTKPALTLPFKYRFLAEIFRAVDTVIQILYNRKETITFRKLKPAVEEMLKRNLFEKHLAQIRAIFPEAFSFVQEKLKIYGNGMRGEQWELVIKPNLDVESMTSEILLERRRKLFNILLDKVKEYHHEFLLSLDTCIMVDKDKVTRWHPEFDLEKVPDIEPSPLPKAPAEDKLTSGKDVLERARVLFNCNTKMELAMQRLKEAKKTQTPLQPMKEDKGTSSETPQSVLKGIPQSLLEKVRQRQAAKALLSITRSADKEKEVQLYSRLPELARLTRNLFVSEKKGVLTLEVVLEKLGNCYRGNLSKTEMEEHLKVLAKEFPTWLVFHDIRNCVYLKLNKNADLSLVLNKLETLCKEKNET
ncbi:DNA replication factor Cdt1 isoform X2 [Anthonomus grandis grandis]|uniref:DNA replication factor Cdt1 isoform X2 n=1 Tax=Anthonomus grandis grandis TaxID=2921223 RepID=UPI0021659041|nr:DNA replication factor Cdt1 isoform X2 [Anthonomus grandis grandis]